MLGFLRLLLETLQRDSVLAQVDPGALFEAARKLFAQRVVQVLAAKMRVACGRLHAEDAVCDLQDRDVERPAPKVVDGDTLAFLLFEAIGERCRSGLVDDSANVEAGDLARRDGRGALRIVEIRGHRHDRFDDVVTEERLGDFSHFFEHHRGDFRRRVLMVLDLDPRISAFALHHPVRHHAHVLLRRLGFEGQAHQALDREHRALRVGDALALRDAAYTPFAVLRERHDRRCGTAALCVWNDLRLSVVDKRDTRVGRSQIDPNDLPHLALALFIPRAGGLSHLSGDYSPLVPSAASPGDLLS